MRVLIVVLTLMVVMKVVWIAVIRTNINSSDESSINSRTKD